MYTSLPLVFAEVPRQGLAISSPLPSICWSSHSGQPSYHQPLFVHPSIVPITTAYYCNMYIITWSLNMTILHSTWSNQATKKQMTNLQFLILSMCVISSPSIKIFLRLKFHQICLQLLHSTRSWWSLLSFIFQLCFQISHLYNKALWDSMWHMHGKDLFTNTVQLSSTEVWFNSWLSHPPAWLRTVLHLQLDHL